MMKLRIYATATAAGLDNLLAVVTNTVHVEEFLAASGDR